MKLPVATILFSAFAIPLLGIAADYDYIDPGDRYYINRFGSENDYVVVVRKLGNGNVKVRNLDSYSTSVVNASELLSKSELDRQESRNFWLGVGAAALGVCAASENCGKKH